MRDGWLYTRQSTKVEWHTDGTVWFTDPDGTITVALPSDYYDGNIVKGDGDRNEG